MESADTLVALIIGNEAFIALKRGIRRITDGASRAAGGSRSAGTARAMSRWMKNRAWSIASI